MTTPSDLLEPLAWDSGHFGYLVACIPRADADEAELRDALNRAARDGVRLVYWMTGPGRYVSGELLRQFNGTLADRKVTFAAPVSELLRGRWSVVGCEIREYPRGAACPHVLQLGIDAGAFSRFRRDPRIPAAKADSLFSIWIERSAQRELADGVWVARVPEVGFPVGVVTARREEDAASLGLLAVNAGWRGRGIGQALLDAAHRWMDSQRIPTARVVTQRENAAACTAYNKSGYRSADERDVYHFWP